MSYRNKTKAEYMKEWRARRKDHIKAYDLAYKLRKDQEYQGFCKCGCGAAVKGYDFKAKKPIEYKWGHNPQDYSNRPRGKDHKNYKGGWVLANGYRAQSITTDEGHKTVLEHRIVIENKIGRKLDRYEHVHHIDGNKLNNNLKNLVVLSAHDHQKLHKAGGLLYGFQTIS